jgi:UDP:flavonoid glycosyltransferase YjiC (YdhE family)
MRILFSTLSGFGHFHPLVPLARALKQAGHEVAFAAPPSFREVIEHTGFRYFPAGGDLVTVSPAEAQRQQAEALADMEKWLTIMADMLVTQAAQKMVPGLLAACKEFRPQLLVRNQIEFAACAVAEHLNLPHVSVQVTAGTPALIYSPPVVERLNALRASLGLEADPDSQMPFRYLHLSFVPPSFNMGMLDMVPTGHAMRPVIFDQSGDESLPAWTERVGKRPLVYVTLGTLFNKLHQIFTPIIAGLRDEPIELAVTVGRDQDPAVLGPQPPNVHVERYIPQTLLFPRCSVAILHGGWNSVVSALCHGIPLLIVPVAADNPLNAEACQQLGVGKVIQPQELSPERVRTAVHELLNDPSYRQKAQAIQKEVQALPGMDQAVKMVERVATERQPIPR